MQKRRKKEGGRVFDLGTVNNKEPSQKTYRLGRFGKKIDWRSVDKHELHNQRWPISKGGKQRDQGKGWNNQKRTIEQTHGENISPIGRGW